MLRRSSQWIFALGVLAVLFFALRPAPTHSGRTAGLPASLAEWINEHDTLANFVMLAGLGSLGALAATHRAGPASPSRAGCIFSLLALLVVALELGQLWIPGRVFDWDDVLAGWWGLIAGWIPMRCLMGLCTRG